jgi:hypothetical protein
VPLRDGTFSSHDSVSIGSSSLLLLVLSTAVEPQPAAADPAAGTEAAQKVAAAPVLPQVAGPIWYRKSCVARLALSRNTKASMHVTATAAAADLGKAANGGANFVVAADSVRVALCYRPIGDARYVHATRVQLKLQRLDASQIQGCCRQCYEAKLTASAGLARGAVTGSKHLALTTTRHSFRCQVGQAAVQAARTGDSH